MVEQDEWPPEVGSTWLDSDGDEFTVLNTHGAYVFADYGSPDGTLVLRRHGWLSPWTKVRGAQS